MPDHRAPNIVRSVGSNEFKSTHAYSSGLPASITAADGVVTTFEYDAMLRLVKKTVGSGGTSPYPGRVEEYRYDGANRLVWVYPLSTSSSPTITEYDGAGRVKKTKAPKPDTGGGTLDTTLTYNAVNQTTSSSPIGATTIAENHLDGRPKTITGTAQPPVYFDYAVTSTGLKITRKNHASDLNQGWVEEQQDWLGRVVTRSTPTAGYHSSSAPNKIIDTVCNYNSAGQLWRERTYYRQTSSYLSADRIRTYDAVGRLTWEGLDVNNSGSLTTASNDRITAYDNWFTQDGWGWLNVSTVTTLATLNSSTATQVSYVNARLTGFNQGFLSNGRYVVGDVVTGRIATVAGVSGSPSFTYHYATSTNWVDIVTSNVANTYARTNTLVTDRGVLAKIETT